MNGNSAALAGCTKRTHVSSKSIQDDTHLCQLHSLRTPCYGAEDAGHHGHSADEDIGLFRGQPEDRPRRLGAQIRVCAQHPYSDALV